MWSRYAPRWTNDERGRAMVARDRAMTRLLESLGSPDEALFRERCNVDGAVSEAAMHGLLRRQPRTSLHGRLAQRSTC